MPLNRPDKIIEININALKEDFIELIKNSNVFCYAANPKTIIKLADKDIIAFIDTGSKINIIDEKKTDS